MASLLHCEKCQRRLKFVEDPWGKFAKCAKCGVSITLDDEQFRAAAIAESGHAGYGDAENSDIASGLPWDQYGLMGFASTVLQTVERPFVAFSKMRRSGGWLSPVAFIFVAGVANSVAMLIATALLWLVTETLPRDNPPLLAAVVTGTLAMAGLIPFIAVLAGIWNGVLLHFVLKHTGKPMHGYQTTLRAYAIAHGVYLVCIAPLHLTGLQTMNPVAIFGGGCLGLFAAAVQCYLLVVGVATAQQCSRRSVFVAVVATILLDVGLISVAIIQLGLT